MLANWPDPVASVPSQEFVWVDAKAPSPPPPPLAPAPRPRFIPEAGNFKNKRCRQAAIASWDMVRLRELKAIACRSKRDKQKCMAAPVAGGVQEVHVSSAA